MGNIIAVVIILGMILGLMILTISAIWVQILIQQGYRPEKSQGVKSRKRATAYRSAAPQTSQTRPRQKGYDRELLRMLQGDQGAMQRLLSNIKRREPGHSEQWYIDKVKWDLKRDRRS